MVVAQQEEQEYAHKSKIQTPIYKVKDKIW